MQLPLLFCGHRNKIAECLLSAPAVTDTGLSLTVMQPCHHIDFFVTLVIVLATMLMSRKDHYFGNIQDDVIGSIKVYLILLLSLQQRAIFFQKAVIKLVLCHPFFQNSYQRLDIAS